MNTVAVIGAGIAGLGCAHFLHRRFDLTVYEKEGRAGGHTHTVSVLEGERTLPIDTGFMVYNEVTYPNLTRLFRELGVVTKPAPMSFSVQHRPSGLEFSGSSLNHLFAQRRNLLRPRYWRMLLQIRRFNEEAVAALSDQRYQEMPLRDYVEHRGYGGDFLERYLVPMSSAVWSTSPARMLEFPAVTLLRFFHNHGFLGLHTQHPWRTVVNGARSYVERMIRPWAGRIRLAHGAVAVRREGGQAVVTDAGGGEAAFDHVILACHADEALRLLGDADGQEREVLRAFEYQTNSALLHTDESVMPRSKLCWSAWNYRIDAGGEPPSTVYWMNRLQGVSNRRNYFVSINGEPSVHPDKVLRRMQYEHPIFTPGAIRAQQKLPVLNRRKAMVSFCGSYFRYGFHEDAFSSALELCRMLTGEPLWE